MNGSGTELLRVIIGEDTQETDDAFPLIHSERVCFFKYPTLEVEHQNVILTTELVIAHRNQDFPERFGGRVVA